MSAGGIAVDGSRPTARGPCAQVCGAGLLGGKNGTFSHGHGTAMTAWQGICLSLAARAGPEET
jgi:hypothetical protein